MLVEKSFTNLQTVAQFNAKVEPCKYWGYLLAGIILSVWGVYFQVHLWGAGCLTDGVRRDGAQASSFLDGDIEDLGRSENLGFLSTVAFLFVILYVYFSAIHGNIKFGLRFFSVTFYPLVPGETFCNSFIVNAILLNLYTPACVFFICDLFRQYTRGTEAAKFMNVIARHQVFYGWAFQRGVFVIAIITWSYTSLLYFILKPREKIDDGDIKARDLGSK